MHVIYQVRGPDVVVRDNGPGRGRREIAEQAIDDKDATVQINRAGHARRGNEDATTGETDGNDARRVRTIGTKTLLKGLARLGGIVDTSVQNQNIARYAIGKRNAALNDAPQGGAREGVDPDS